MCNADLAAQLAVSDFVQIAQEHHLERHFRIDARPAAARAVALRHRLTHERKVQDRLDLAQEVVLGNELFHVHILEEHRFRTVASEHPAIGLGEHFGRFPQSTTRLPPPHCPNAIFSTAF
jgi:hypothetical protein